MYSKLALILDDIKIQHTLFAMPFALMSAFLAADGMPDLHTLFWIIMAMVGARSAAMTFNRLTDQEFDKDNPRTWNRALASGRAKRPEYIMFLVFTIALFELSCYMLNDLSLKLSPIALIIVFFYSLTKRFTHYSHFVLGFALGLAPVGAWVAVREEISSTSLVLMGAVIFWLAGLDIIYSCQDSSFDKKANLFSFPSRYGVEKSLRASLYFHIITIIFLLVLFVTANMDSLYLVGVNIATLLLMYEHSIVRPNDLTRVNVAFFNVNGLISLEIASFAIADLLWI